MRTVDLVMVVVEEVVVRMTEVIVVNSVVIQIEVSVTKAISGSLVIVSAVIVQVSTGGSCPHTMPRNRKKIQKSSLILFHQQLFVMSFII